MSTYSDDELERIRKIIRDSQGIPSDEIVAELRAALTEIRVAGTRDLKEISHSLASIANSLRFVSSCVKPESSDGSIRPFLRVDAP